MKSDVIIIGGGMHYKCNAGRTIDEFIIPSLRTIHTETESCKAFAKSNKNIR